MDSLPYRARLSSWIVLGTTLVCAGCGVARGLKNDAGRDTPVQEAGGSADANVNGDDVRGDGPAATNCTGGLADCDSSVAGDGSTSSTDGGGDASPNLFLSRGMNNYTVTAVSNVQDGCMTGVTGLLNGTLPVNAV